MNYKIITAGVMAVVILSLVLYRRIKKRGGQKVPQGLQVWDEQGQIVLDTNDRLGRVLGQVQFSGDGSITDSRLLDGAGFCFAQFHTPPTEWPATAPLVHVTFSGATMSWQNYRDASGPTSGVIFYGVW